jgi:hypothetical protein
MTGPVDIHIPRAYTSDNLSFGLSLAPTLDSRYDSHSTTRPGSMGWNNPAWSGWKTAPGEGRWGTTVAFYKAECLTGCIGWSWGE